MKIQKFLKRIAFLIPAILAFFSDAAADYPEALLWHRHELVFTSAVDYENPVQDLRTFEVSFLSPTGMTTVINGFWDGGRVWKARFMPCETGLWSFRTSCSDERNDGLNGKTGSFLCGKKDSVLDIYEHGPVSHPEGRFYLTHQDGKPFFWLACTAWNGALKSGDDEWDQYLYDRASKNYNVIQIVTTQWRGCDKSSEGKVAFEGSGRIRIDPEFFRLIDRKIDRINDFGLVAAPVLLWALQSGRGRELSPGYYLPDDQAILLARYVVARYGGNHVVWFLGGDGNYTGTFEQRWKTIGRSVFNGRHQGLVAQHPQGGSWIGELYRDEPWLDIVGYQSSHSNAEQTVNWITKGPVSVSWQQLPARPLINLEPLYEQIREAATDRDIRNACCWSLFAAPVAGISYGANGIWPWLRKGETILNHSDAPWTQPWNESLNLPGAIQLGNIAGLIRKHEWWNLFPAGELLTEQPGLDKYDQFISLVSTSDKKLMMGYSPSLRTFGIRNISGYTYSISWFDPVTNRISEGRVTTLGNVIRITPPSDSGMLFILEKH